MYDLVAIHRLKPTWPSKAALGNLTPDSGHLGILGSLRKTSPFRASLAVTPLATELALSGNKLASKTRAVASMARLATLEKQAVFHSPYSSRRRRS
jgi:hypothetical protein